MASAPGKDHGTGDIWTFALEQEREVMVKGRFSVSWDGGVKGVSLRPREAVLGREKEWAGGQDGNSHAKDGAAFGSTARR